MNDVLPLTRIGWVAYVNIAALVPFALITWITYYIACWWLEVCPHDSHSDASFWLTGIATGIVERFFFAFGVALTHLRQQKVASSGVAWS
jgi:hypothetical protein